MRTKTDLNKKWRGASSGFGRDDRAFDIGGGESGNGYFRCG